MHVYLMSAATAKDLGEDLEKLRLENNAEIFDTDAFQMTPLYTTREQDAFAIESNRSFFIFIEDGRLFERVIPEVVKTRQQWKKITNRKVIDTLVARKADVTGAP